MAQYTPKTWTTGETIDAAKLNALETAAAAAAVKTDADAAYDARGAATSAQAAAVAAAATDATTKASGAQSAAIAAAATDATTKANAAQAAAVQRANHTGTQSADTLTDGTTNKAYTAAEKTKLAGVATSATANATDAALRDRSTHTGMQAASTVTGLSTVATSGAYADLSGKPTIPATAADVGAVSSTSLDAAVAPLVTGGSTTAVALGAAYGLDHSTQVSKIFVHGHSYAAGDATLSGGAANRWGTRLASWLRATETNIAVAGSRLTSGGATAGGVNTLLQNYAPARTAAPYVSSLQAAFLHHGINDATYMSAAQFALSIPETLGAAIDRYRAGAVFEDNHASVTVASGSWNNFTATIGSGTTWRYTAGNGSLNIAVPAGYAGQAITIGLIGPSNTSFTATVSKGGTTLATYDTAAKVASVPLGLDVCCRIRIPAGTLPAGAQTLVLAFSNVTGPNAIFDYWSIEALVPPPVFLVMANRLGSLGYTTMNATAAFPLSDAVMTRINDTLQAVANSYTDGRVVTVPTDDLFPDGANLAASDGVHPNTVGHGLIAGRLRQAMRDYFATNATDLPYLGIA